MSAIKLYFSLGPVQSFVSKARRTRDYWAGSFLLSYLTAEAMNYVIKNGGTIETPAFTKTAFYKAFNGILNEIDPNELKYGTLPNQFEAVFENKSLEDVEDIAKSVECAVRVCWENLARIIWKNELAGFVKNLKNFSDQTSGIWDSQIRNFWEIIWVVDPDPASSASALHARKNWRTHFPPDQGGAKCSVMGEWTELSGFHPSQRQKQREFWDKLRAHIRNNDAKRNTSLDFGENERLCAIAYVKRRFPHYWKEFLEWRFNGKDNDNSRAEKKVDITDIWQIKDNIPSLHWIAAHPWLKGIIELSDKSSIDSVNKFLDNDLPLSEPGIKGQNIKGPLRRFTQIDGKLLFPSELNLLAAVKESDRDRAEISPETAKKLKAALRELTDNLRKLDKSFPREPSPFFAFLLMDGDKLGELKKKLSEVQMGADKKGLSEKLVEFSSSVYEIVGKYDGFLIYAGGDDVAALLPLTTALDCAAELRKKYRNILGELFEGTDNPEASYQPGISAAVIFAHAKVPFSAVIGRGHYLLDEIAKEQTGRDALAVEVWKGSGVQLTWSMPWKYALDDKNNLKLLNLLERIYLLSEDLEQQNAISAKTLYKMIHTVQAVFPSGEGENLPLLDNFDPSVPGKERSDKCSGKDELLNHLLAGDLLAGKILNNSENNSEKARSFAEELSEQLKVYGPKNGESGGFDYRVEHPCYRPDGLKLLRFLGQHSYFFKYHRKSAS